ncbi:MAG TPA: hypothetical protein VM260_09815 [Pirellula sp.]|nr:hypothetical protein [Pirellula sp.]
MNEDQLEACLKKLKSSSREPDKIDGCLEKRMMELCSGLKKNRRRTKRLAVIMALLLVSGTGFVAFGGDSAVMNYIAPSAEKDAEGNPVLYDFSWGKWMHSIHDHLREHFRSQHSGS